MSVGHYLVISLFGKRDYRLKVTIKHVYIAPAPVIGTFKLFRKNRSKQWLERTKIPRTFIPNRVWEDRLQTIFHARKITGDNSHIRWYAITRHINVRKEQPLHLCINTTRIQPKRKHMGRLTKIVYNDSYIHIARTSLLERSRSFLSLLSSCGLAKA